MIESQQLSSCDIEAMGIKLSLKAAGQKVGLAEVSIRLVREKARATKAGVRAMFGYMPANQFNVDLYAWTPSQCSIERSEMGRQLRLTRCSAGMSSTTKETSDAAGAS